MFGCCREGQLQNKKQNIVSQDIVGSKDDRVDLFTLANK